jgi:membrane-associated phospholipid phosphatase
MSIRTEILSDALGVLRDTWQVIKRIKWWILLLFLSLAAMTCALLPHDPALHRHITEDRLERLIKISNKYRRWGDFRDTVTITLVVFGVGLVARRRSWRTAAVACFLSASLAGLSVNAVRFTAGRPRPSANMPDGFYGPTFKYRMQSFPSGHAATSTGNAVALAIALPGAGVPVLVFSAAGVVWSSLYSRTHYVSDVSVGVAIGMFFGVIVGIVTRRRNRLIADPPAKAG